MKIRNDRLRNVVPTVMAFLALAHAIAVGQVTIDPGTVVAAEGDPAVSVPVSITGGLDVTDMVGIVQIGGGGAVVGQPAEPLVTDVDYVGSIWGDAPGGFTSFFASSSPPASTVDPNVSLLIAGESVAATGVLMTVTIDASGFPPGDYPILLSGTVGGDTRLFESGSEVTVTAVAGTLRILSALEVWRSENFGSDVENPFLEDSVWGNDADPDGDGLENLGEFAFGTDPNSPSNGAAGLTSTGLPALAFDSMDVPELIVSQRGGTPEFDLVIETSEDLVTWSDSAVVFDVSTGVPIGDGIYELVTYTPSPPPTETRLFFRVRVDEEVP